MRACLIDLASCAIELASGMATPTVSVTRHTPEGQRPCACGCARSTAEKFATPACRREHARQAYIARRDSRRVPELDDAKWLREQYVDEGMSLSEVGELIGVTAEAVPLALRRAGIPARSPGSGRAAEPIAA